MMSDLRTILERGIGGATPPPDGYERMLRRRDRKRRNQRIGAGALAIVLALVSFVALTRAFRTTERPADEPTPKSQGIFSEVGGWIAYNKEGIWAVNPTRPGHPEEQIQLSERAGEPLAWSSDGSKLLIERRGRHGRRWNGLFVLNADGTEVRVAFGPTFGSGSAVTHYFTGGSFSPDGSRVVYADLMDTEGGESSKIYTVASDGGTPQFLHASQSVSPEFFDPAFSPDGQQIAYIAGWGDHDNGVWVMNADGSGARELADPAEVENPHRILGWSTDGSRIFVDGCCESGVWVVGANGSGIAPLLDDLVANPHLSPERSRIAYEPFPLGTYSIGPLEIADLDGTHVQKFGYGAAGPWNPLPRSTPGSREPTVTVGGSGAAPFVYAIAVLGAVGVLVITWRARRRTAAR